VAFPSMKLPMSMGRRRRSLFRPECGPGCSSRPVAQSAVRLIEASGRALDFFGEADQAINALDEPSELVLVDTSIIV
jgi:hypothetical protein